MLCCPDVCAAPLDEYHRTRGRGESADRDGESPGRREGKKDAARPGDMGKRQGAATRSPNRLRAERGTKVLGDCDESCQRWCIQAGELRRLGERPDRERHREPARVEEPTSWSLRDPAAGMKNGTERHEHSDRDVPAIDAASGEQGSIHRPRHAAGRSLSLLGQPFGEQRSILCGRSRVWDGPSRFLGRETLAKPETEPSITYGSHRWQRKKTQGVRSLTAMRQR